MQPTPTTNPDLPLRTGDFSTLAEAIDYAAQGQTGLNFYSARGDLVDRMTYAELRTAAVSGARRLLGMGLMRGDRVVLLADTCREFVEGFFSCIYAGLVPAPVAIPVVFGEHAEYIAGLRRRVLGCGARAVIGTTGLQNLLAEAVGDLDLLYAGPGADLANRPETDIELVPPKAEDLAYLQYSSGSTRDPAGIEIPHHVLMANSHFVAAHGLQAREGDRCVSWLPLYHDMGFVGFLLMPAAMQMSIDLIPTREFVRRPITWLQLISRNRGTLSYSPSFGYELCTRQAARASLDGLDLSSWRAAGIGGDMVRPQILDDFARMFAPHGFRKTAFVPSYGLAEVTLAISFAPLDKGPREYRLDRRKLADGFAVDAAPEDHDPRMLVSCGTILPAHAAEIRDDSGQVQGDRIVGRVYLRGPSLMRGYYLNPDETARILSPDGWLDSGDLGFSSDGEIILTGRAKDLILVNGRNVWPQDIEWQVEALERMRRGDACAFSLDDGGKQEHVVLLVQCRSSDPEIRETIRQSARGVLRKMGVGESEVRLVPPGALPQTSSGKLSRSAARKKFLAGAFEAFDRAPASGPAPADEAV